MRWLKWNQQSPAQQPGSGAWGSASLHPFHISSISLIAISVFLVPLNESASCRCRAVISTDYPVMKMLHEIMWDVFVLFLSDKSYHCINLQTYWVQSAILSWTGRQKANYCQDFVMTPHHLFSMLLKHFWITEDSLTMLLSPHLGAVVCWCLLLSPHRFPHTPRRGCPAHCGQWSGKNDN